jgi:hypothetical protein
MAERISFIHHKGKEILLIDFSHCEPKQILAMLDQIQQTVAHHAPGSMLTLADMTDAHVDRSTITRMKEVLVRDRPFVKRSAWVGVDSIPKVYYENIKSFTQREIPLFQTREEAMDWLVKEK